MQQFSDKSTNSNNTTNALPQRLMVMQKQAAGMQKCQDRYDVEWQEEENVLISQISNYISVQY